MMNILCIGDLLEGQGVLKAAEGCGSHAFLTEATPLLLTRMEMFLLYFFFITDFVHILPLYLPSLSSAGQSDPHRVLSG